MIGEGKMDYETMKRHVADSLCAECGGRLNIATAPGVKGVVLRCSKDIAHTGTMMVPQEQMNVVNRRRREQLTQQIGEKETHSLVTRFNGVLTLTKKEATEIVGKLWPNAPAVEVYKAINICVTYHLNPLMGHVFLIPFHNKKTNRDDYVAVLSIKATRLITSRRHRYSYLDDSPRYMTEEEEKKIYGSVDPSQISMITKLKNLDSGAEASGFGRWPKSVGVYGADKGNSASNMAQIRSERQAFDRLFPAETPPDVEVFDERYAPKLEVTKGTMELWDGKEPVAPAAASAEPPAEAVVEGQFAEVSPDAQPPVESIPVEPPAEKIDSAWLTESMKAIKWSEKTALSWIFATFKLEAKKVSEAVDKMTLDQAKQFANHIREMVELK